jgi:hypothetical protein
LYKIARNAAVSEVRLAGFVQLNRKSTAAAVVSPAIHPWVRIP